MESNDNPAFQYKDSSFQIVKGQKPKPEKGHVLIKVAYSTINPFDRYLYDVTKDEGTVLGSEGCGVVEEVGEGVDASL